MHAPPSSYRRAPIYAFNVFPVFLRPRHRKPPLQPSQLQAQVLVPDTFTVKLNRIHLRLLEEQRHHINSLEHELASCRQHMYAQATHLHSQSAKLDSQAAQIAVMQQQLLNMQKGSTDPTVMQRLAALEQYRQHAEAHSALATSLQPSVGCQGDLSARAADPEQHLGVFRKQLQNSTPAIDADHAEASASDTASDAASDTTSDTASNTVSYPPDHTASCSANDTSSDTGSDTGSGAVSNRMPKWAEMFITDCAARLDRCLEEARSASQQALCKVASLDGEPRAAEGVKGLVNDQGSAERKDGCRGRLACGVSTPENHGARLLALLQATGRDQYGSGGLWNGGVDNGFFH